MPDCNRGAHDCDGVLRLSPTSPPRGPGLRTLRSGAHDGRGVRRRCCGRRRLRDRRAVRGLSLTPLVLCILGLRCGAHDSRGMQSCRRGLRDLSGMHSLCRYSRQFFSRLLTSTAGCMTRAMASCQLPNFLATPASHALFSISLAFVLVFGTALASNLLYSACSSKSLEFKNSSLQSLISGTMSFIDSLRSHSTH